MQDFSYNGGQLTAGHFMEMDGMANEPDAFASIDDLLLVGSSTGSTISLCDLGPMGGLDYCVHGATAAHTSGYLKGIGID